LPHQRLIANPSQCPDQLEVFDERLLKPNRNRLQFKRSVDALFIGIFGHLNEIRVGPECAAIPRIVGSDNLLFAAHILSPALATATKLAVNPPFSIIRVVSRLNNYVIIFLDEDDFQ